jgi:hypothetical protein
VVAAFFEGRGLYPRENRSGPESARKLKQNAECAFRSGKNWDCYDGKQSGSSSSQASAALGAGKSGVEQFEWSLITRVSISFILLNQ